jgi:hypothetical protein
MHKHLLVQNFLWKSTLLTPQEMQRLLSWETPVQIAGFSSSNGGDVTGISASANGWVIKCK